MSGKKLDAKELVGLVLGAGALSVGVYFGVSWLTTKSFRKLPKSETARLVVLLDYNVLMFPIFF